LHNITVKCTVSGILNIELICHLKLLLLLEFLWREWKQDE